MSTAEPSLTALAESLLSDVKKYESGGRHDRASRMALQQTARNLEMRLKDPKQAMFDHCTNMTESINLRALLEMKVPENIPREGSITSKELAGKTGADESLIIRLMRILTVTGIFKSVATNEYTHTPFSLALLDGHEVDFFKLMVDEIFVATTRLPEYFSIYGAHDTLSATETPHAWAFDQYGKLNFYETVSLDPKRIKQFSVAMATQDAMLPALGMYDFGAELANSADLDTRPLIVDIGGGLGQSLTQIKEKWPKLEGKMILQDKPHVLAMSGDLGPGIEKQAHNFFQEQPVKDAHVYYIRRCLHNWTDELCSKIIKAVVPAMASDSKLLIGEMIVPEADPESNAKVSVGDMTAYWMDHAMFTFGGRERTLKDFENLLQGAGLELASVHEAPSGTQAVLEARLKTLV